MINIGKFLFNEEEITLLEDMGDGYYNLYFKNGHLIQIHGEQAQALWEKWINESQVKNLIPVHTRITES